METMMVLLNTIDRVKRFSSIVSNCDFDMDLASGRYVLDAKSIMGIFSLNLSNPIKLIVYTDDIEKISDLKLKLNDYIIRQ